MVAFSREFEPAKTKAGKALHILKHLPTSSNKSNVGNGSKGWEVVETDIPRENTIGKIPIPIIYGQQPTSGMGRRYKE